ncbi:ROK family glucokinase [Aeromicrobium sp. CF4.19]|uniref:ROK family glucokinase n=1 Tax=Aeromicrobium sp. CF4.19 TaxID=3373082 RepID=UPI003EE6E6B0
MSADLGVGIDIGGTKIAGGVVAADGRLMGSRSIPTPEDAGRIAAAVADLVQALCTEHADGGSIGGIGVGAAGFVSVDRSTVTFAPNIDWRDEPLGADIAALTGRPVVVENDANAAAWGEFRFGAGADAGDLLLVTVGTGVGGGIVQRGALVRGGFGAAGEIGHLRLVRDGRPCGCGQRGCFEQYASGSALVADARARATSDPRGGPLVERAGSAEQVTGPMVTELAQAGDPLSLELLRDLGRWLGEGCADLATVLDPSVIGLGGGVGAAGALLTDAVVESFLQHLPARSHRRIPEIRLATLGQDAGLVGAADLGRIVTVGESHAEPGRG